MESILDVSAARDSSGDPPQPVLAVSHLSKRFGGKGQLRARSRKDRVVAVHDVSFTVDRGTTFALVGETGSGKTTIGRIVAGLEVSDTGSVLINGESLAGSSRGNRLRMSRLVHMVFQDPYSSLDPRSRVASIIAEPMIVHRAGNRAEVAQRVRELLNLVGLKADDGDRLPHEFSGGQRQRIAIARGLALAPQVLVLDEPVSALDLSVRAQVTNLLLELQERLATTYLMISHDLIGMRHMADRVGVLYRGRLVEEGAATEVFDRPRHPYTMSLVSSLPGSTVGSAVPSPLGGVADSDALPTSAGCAFASACPVRQDICMHEAPALSNVSGPQHRAACHFSDTGGGAQ